MFCRHCGQKLASEEAVICVHCQCPKGKGDKFCPACGHETPLNAITCPNCGVSLEEKSDKSKMAAGLLGIFLGSFGVHNFYLGYTGKAVAQLVITVATCGIGSFISAIWGFVEGILILTGNIDKDGKGRKLLN